MILIIDSVFIDYFECIFAFREKVWHCVAVFWARVGTVFLFSGREFGTVLLFSIYRYL